MMELTFLTPEKVIDVWAKLEDAYRGESSYGGHVTEIYASWLAPLTPTVALGNHEGPFGKPAFDKYCMQAGRALLWLLDEFQKRRSGCKISIEDGTVEEIKATGFGHRIHVCIKPKEGSEQ